MNKYPYNGYNVDLEYPKKLLAEQKYDEENKFEDLDDYIFCEDEKCYSER